MYCFHLIVLIETFEVVIAWTPTFVHTYINFFFSFISLQFYAVFKSYFASYILKVSSTYINALMCFHISVSKWFLIAVIAVDLKQTVQVDKDLQIRAYYAGHVRFLNLIL